jgi:hypothetical protein
MATNKRPIFIGSTLSSNVEIDPADTTTPQTIFTAGADGGAAINLTATTTDTSAVIVVIRVNDGTTTNVIGEVTVPAGAGTDGSTPAKNLLDIAAMPGVFQADGSLGIGPNSILTVAAKATITAAKVLSISMYGGSYSA